LQSIKQDFANIFKQVDYLITPTTPTTAFRLGDKIADPLAMYLSDLYTVSVNLTGLPAISLPIGNEGKLPIGLQIIGRHWEENQILQLGRVIEKLNND
ncbi:MAG: Asp-tRNA(Asn)/Glu-tRNA(Gln) amidotransferase subunit GatA, partial [Candidatus Aenigmarchaeota archaeon]|nr:Asp-tRNA(Asn)/Glu-tRNA(Gln) amidotransferase subunit GatA [Candidatus Aenigmarchaeota archaeon]